MSKIVFVLGAGASAHFETPLRIISSKYPKKEDFERGFYVYDPTLKQKKDFKDYLVQVSSKDFITKDLNSRMPFKKKLKGTSSI